MIYIISQDFEYSTDRVIDWLNFYNASFLRINGQDIDEKDNLSIHINNENENVLFLNKNKVIEGNIGWYRRFGKASILNNKKTLDKNYVSVENIVNTLKKDRQVLKHFLLKKLNIKHWLTDPQLSSMNKLNVLNLASKLGLDIPSTLVCSSKQKLIDFSKRHNEIVVKAISEVPFMTDKEDYHTFLTHKITKNDIEKIPDVFVPTCFQEMIKKKFEIRVFYLDGNFYSMAIFSQKDESTQVDFRNYNINKPNRNVPYVLPNNICNRLQSLMKEIGLNCGSIDLIKSEANKYVFLEVNPVGQFGMVSKPCNYYLEEKVARYLIN